MEMGIRPVGFIVLGSGSQHELCHREMESGLYHCSCKLDIETVQSGPFVLTSGGDLSAKPYDIYVIVWVIVEVSVLYDRQRIVIVIVGVSVLYDRHCICLICP